jgi:hypothetical protein
MPQKLPALQPVDPHQIWLPNAQKAASDAIQKFMSNPGLHKIVAEFDEDFAHIEDVDSQLDHLVQIGSKYWDFRQGRERAEVVEKAAIDDPATDICKKIFEGARQLGLVKASAVRSASERYYDVLVIPGGINKAPLNRLQYALSQPVRYGLIAALGCEREVSDAEQQNTATYAPEARTEFDLLEGAVTTLLGGEFIKDEVYTVATATWRIKHYAGKNEPVMILSAPPQDGRLRANTADTYDFLRRVVDGGLNPQSRLLLVTTAPYVLFQHFDALREITLQTGAHVQTIGHDAAISGSTKSASQLLQEVLSAANSAQKLRDALKATQNS